MGEQQVKLMDGFIRTYDPEMHNPVHCSNCKHAVVGGECPDLRVRCECGHGKGRETTMYAILRAKNPRGFAAASKCVDFFSMND